MWNDRRLGQIVQTTFHATSEGFVKKELYRPMKLLLIGPYPPPYGGISVHVALAQEELRREGIRCHVVRIDKGAPESEHYIRIRGGLELVRVVFDHARRGWTPHVHTNGHTVKGWFIALACGVAGHCAAAKLLTIHSGMTPAFLAGGRGRKLLARISCSRFQRIICVSPEIRETLQACGVSPGLLEVLPAYLEDRRKPIPPPDILKKWLQSHAPLLSTALSFRPEYGFDILLAALQELRRNKPTIGLVVIGGDKDLKAGKQQVASCELEDSVLLLGEVPHDLCLSLIASSDGFVRATRADGDSIAVREALARGIPVVASDVCQRPTGTVLFRSGDASDLALTIEKSLRGERRVPAECRTEGEQQRLIEMYTHVVHG